MKTVQSGYPEPQVLSDYTIITHNMKMIKKILQHVVVP